MTITAAGFAGTVTEAQWSGINGSTPHAEGSGWACSAFTTNNLPQVQVAAGYINGQGVRAYNDAPALVTLTAPGAGGAWYLIAARRTWSPTATVTLVTIAGTTTGSTTVPIAPPSAFPAALSNTPGTVADQPLAWAFVAAGSTVATVFDARLRRTGAGTLLVGDPFALQAYFTLGVFDNGAVVGMDAWSPLNSGRTVDVVRPSTWTLRGIGSGGITAYYKPLSTLRVSTSAALAALNGVLSGTALPNVEAFASETRAYLESNGVTYLYVGAGNTALQANAASSAWQAWEKAPTPFVPVWAGSAISPGSSTVVAFWGIAAGTVWVDIALTAGTGYGMSPTNDVVITLPISVVAALGGGSGQYQRGGGTGANNQADLIAYGVGTPGAQSTSVRVRAKYVNAAPGGVNQNILGTVVTATTTTDTFQIHFQAPCAAVV